MRTSHLVASAVGLACIAVAADADVVQIRVTAENLAPTGSVAFAPLRLAFNGGVYDSFNESSAASPAIISIAEGGSGDAWFPAFMLAEPLALLGSVVPDPAGPLLPGASASAVFEVDPMIHPYFTFGSMVVPSNDYFIGNDSPTRYRLFDDSGGLAISMITQFGRDIWDAGSEVDGPFGAAFLEGYSNPDHIDEGGVVEFDFMDLDVFNGLTTAAGYTFQRQFGADDALYRITFEVVPAPGPVGVMGLAAVVPAIRRRRPG